MTDSIEDGTRRLAMRELGAIDLQVTGGGRTFDPDVASRLASGGPGVGLAGRGLQPALSWTAR